ncbi:uncharacterized protein LOC124434519 isoform X1 [Xenia sp. Carnegie-2017]|uniref:uncharacterized protein LOC124434519 isoform X1 n=2 Tax=Xenia sp. Carnegie-2017 TaxID=2897299 RepID=UPI001F04A126|nr:uncharacterized protein LOC124434519 isoform X1 [Xenia sp. Carnegie-2017]
MIGDTFHKDISKKLQFARQKEIVAEIELQLERLRSIREPLSLEVAHENISESRRSLQTIIETSKVEQRRVEKLENELVSKMRDKFANIKIERKIVQETTTGVPEQGEENEDHPHEATEETESLLLTFKEHEDNVNDSQNILKNGEESFPLEHNESCINHQTNMLSSNRESLPLQCNESDNRQRQRATDNEVCCLDPRKMIFCKRSCGLVALQVMLREEGVPFCMSRLCQKLQQNLLTRRQEKLEKMDGLLPCPKVLPFLYEKKFFKEILLERGFSLEEVKDAFKNSGRKAGVLLYHTKSISHCVNLVNHMKEVKINDWTNGRDDPIDFDKALSAQVVVLSYTNDEDGKIYGISVIGNEWDDCYSDICKTKYIQSHANNGNVSCSSREEVADGL